MDSSYRPLTDEAAMGRIRNVERTARSMVAAYYSGWPAADRDDLVSVVLEKYFKKWGRGPGPDPLGPWLTTVVKNAARDLHRANARKDSDKLGLGNETEADWDLERALRDLGTPSRLVGGLAWDQAFALLRPSDRDLIVWRYVDGDTVEDIAGRLGKNTEAVRKSLQRAVQRLNSVLNDHPELRNELRAGHPRLY